MDDEIKNAKSDLIEFFRKIDQSPKLHYHLVAEVSYHNLKSVFCKCFPTITFNSETGEWVIRHRAIIQGELFRGLIITDKDTLELFDKYK